jgi:hypothetical protein
MQLEYSSTVDRADWHDVLEHASLANVFHTPTYFDLQQRVGHALVYLGCYHAGRPIGIIAGYRNTFGYHAGLLEIGTKSGGYPVLIDAYETSADAAQIKQACIAAFAARYLDDQPFLFYPCFHLQTVPLFEDPASGCLKQYDSTAFLDLQQPEVVLWKHLRDKGRNLVRYARRHGVTARIANEQFYFEQFYQFYKAVRVKHGTQYIGYDELQAKFDVFTRQNLADLWVAFVEDTPAAYAFIWKYRRTINFVYGSSDPAWWRDKPNNLLQWELICYYQQQGYTLYNMWGLRNMNLSETAAAPAAERPVEGYGKFKLSFGPEVRELVRYARPPGASSR